MTSVELSPEPRLTFRAEPDGSTRVDLMDGDRSISWLWIVPLTIRVGKAVVRMDGIGGVNTREEFRRRGYSRRVLQATVERMRQGDAALSMLYGIPNFYPKFGYTTAGPDHFIHLTGLADVSALPDGWRDRLFEPADLPAVRRLYDQGTADGVGCAVRSPEAGPWHRLTHPKSGTEVDCRVVEDPSGQIRAYAWRAGWHWSTGFVERDHPDALVIAEAMADGPAAADALLAACRAWAAEPTERRPEPAKQIILSLPPEGPVAAAAMYQRARFVRHYAPCGSSMVRVVDVRRLLEALKPVLSARLTAAGSRFSGVVEFQTECGDAVLTVAPDGTLSVAEADEGRAGRPELSGPMGMDRTDRTDRTGRLVIRLPQQTLARLALGAFPPEDLLARLGEPLEEKAAFLARTLFPLRHPHMYLPDRY